MNFLQVLQAVDCYTLYLLIWWIQRQLDQDVHVVLGSIACGLGASCEVATGSD